MSEGSGQGRMVLFFLVIMGLTAAAAVPFLPQPRSAAVVPEPVVLPEDEPEKAPEPAPKAAKAKPRKRDPRTINWGGGSESTPEAGQSVGHGPASWFCRKCNRVYGHGKKPPALVICCGVTYRNGQATSASSR